MSKNFAPQRGDIVWLDFDPQIGREQAGRRPAVVLSPAVYNLKSQLAWFCPVTTKAKGYPFELPLPEDAPVRGVILTDHLRSLDFRQRNIEFIGRLDPALCEQVLARARRLLE